MEIMELESVNKHVFMYRRPVLGEDKSDEEIIMALSIDKEEYKKGKWTGLARVITKRDGNVDVPGYVDRSKLIKVKSKDGLLFENAGELKIKGMNEIILEISGKDKEFIGLEDPDIFSDKKGIKHIYFTIAFKLIGKEEYETYLGHAYGKSFDRLIAGKPLLGPIAGGKILGFKEVCISSSEIDKERVVLTEMGFFEGGKYFSVISAINIGDLGNDWKYKKIVLDPRNMNESWCAGHLSPCVFFPKEFLNYNGMLVGVVNGREKEEMIDGKLHYKKFRPGLIIFNQKNGKIEWISKEPLFEDPEATTITFASDFVQTGKKEGRLYCHVNDSFVRAYLLEAERIKELLPKNFEKRL